MKFLLPILSVLALHAQAIAPRAEPPQPCTLTVSPQKSPSPLAKDLILFSAEVFCPVARTISAAQIRQAAELAQVAFQDPAVNIPAPSTKIQKLTKALTYSKYIGGGMSVASAVLSAEKASGSAPGNVKTWAEVAAGAAALAAGSVVAEAQLQAAITSAQATTTTGVAAALMDMTALYAIPAGGGLPKSVMFYGSGSGLVVRTIIP